VNRIVLRHQVLTLVVQHIVETIITVTPVDPAVKLVLEDHVKLDSFILKDNLLGDNPDRSILLKMRFYFGIPFLKQSFLVSHIHTFSETAFSTPLIVASIALVKQPAFIRPALSLSYDQVSG